MSSFTDEHIDELKARRQRRQGRQAPPPAANGAAPSGAQSAGAARDLLRGLITNDGPHSEEAPAATHAGIWNEPHTRAHEQDADSDSRIAGVEAQARNDGEKIDELIRRVNEGTPDTDADASSTIQQRRPKGTADLSPDAAPRRRAGRPRLPGTDRPPHSDAGLKRNTRRWAAAATVLVAGTAILLITLGSVGGNHAPGAVNSPTRTATLAQARPGVFGEALHTTIAVIDRQIQAVARRAAAAAQAVRARRAAKRRLARSHASVKRSTHQTPPEQRRPVVESSPPVTAAPQTQNYTPAPAPTGSPSQTSATPQTTSTSRSRPARPTGSDPLGGIGSCVKGC